jgi:opacity protein-like surface antigen
MIRFNRSALSFAAALSLSALLAAAPAQAAQVNKAEYKAGKDKIEADYKADKTACKPLTGNAQDVCQEEAKAKEKNARAALEYAHTGKPADERRLLETKVDGAYDVAKERCDDLAGNAKDVCVREAKTVHEKGLADLKMARQVGDASQDANAAKREADLKLAREQCDSFSGQAKDTCLRNAETRFGKR